MAVDVTTRRGGPLTLKDYNALPDDKDYEIIDGVLYVAARPIASHQDISGRLYLKLAPAAQTAGGAVILDTDLVVDERNTYVSPDIQYFGPEKGAQLDYFHQNRVVPDLVVEILSLSTARRDLITKRNLYAGLGIPHYWIVDPGRPGISECVLGPEGLYVEREVEQGEVFRPAFFPGLEIDLEWLFASSPLIDALSRSQEEARRPAATSAAPAARRRRRPSGR